MKLSDTAMQRIEVSEVGPRDGLQSIQSIMPTLAKKAWIKAKQPGDERSLTAPDMDRMLHLERVTRKREKITYAARIDDLPDGAMVAQSGRALLISGDSVLPWTPDGYEEARPRPSKVRVSVLTPRSTVQAIAAGYVPMVHGSGQRPGDPLGPEPTLRQ